MLMCEIRRNKVDVSLEQKRKRAEQRKNGASCMERSPLSSVS